MSLQEQFTQAQQDSKNLSERPDNMTLLKIYALFKQGSAGDVSGERPGMTDFVNRAKYDAWAALQGTSQEDAQQQYIDLIEELKGKAHAFSMDGLDFELLSIGQLLGRSPDLDRLKLKIIERASVSKAARRKSDETELRRTVVKARDLSKTETQ